MKLSRPLLMSAVSGLAMFVSAPAFGQSVVAGDDLATGMEDEIVVTADRLRGEVETSQPPILELDEEEIASYGAGSIAELVESLSTVTGSGRGRADGPPAFLVNGMRVSSFREMRSYPPESIKKVEILPEEVGLKYGFSADQRVINFILKDNFASREIEMEYGQPERGGTSNKEVEATYLKLNGPSRLNFNFEWNDSSLLTEAERGVVQTSGVSGVATDPSQADYRSLVADSSSFEATANWSTRLNEEGASLSVNGTVERDKSRSLSGLNFVTLTNPDDESVIRVLSDDLVLERRGTTTTYSLGSTLNAPLGDWQLTGTLDASRAEGYTEIDRNADTQFLVDAAADGTLDIYGDLPAITDEGYDTAKTISDAVSSDFTLMGSPLWLPAGPVQLTADAGYSWKRYQSRDTRMDSADASLIRGRLSGGVNLGIPIASRRDDVWSWLGDFTINLTGGVDHLSDFGTLTDWTAGFNWGVTEKLNFQLSYIARDSAPGLSQLSSPEVVSLNESVYDLTNEETVLATVISGGNPDLSKEKQRDLRAAVFWELPFMERSNIMIEYYDNHSEDVSASFPLLTPAIEAAFPDRVTRDGSGRLTSIDQRPITLAEQNSSRLKFGLNLSGSLGSGNSGGRRSQMRAMVQSAESARPAPQGASGAGGPARPGFDPERMQQLRVTLCEKGETPELSTLPAPMQERLKGENGEIDPAKLEQMKSRMCANSPGEGRMAAGGPPPGGRSRGGAGGPPGGRGGPGGPPGGGGGGRWNLNASYTLELENEVLIAPGVPVLDQLNGDSLSGGGVVRHSAEIRGGVFYSGFGGILRASYSGPSQINGSELTGSSDLHYSDLTTLNLRFFADLGRQEKLVSEMPFLKGTRVSFRVDNVLDTYRKVTNADGEIPLRYQRGIMEPEGRSFEIEFRKIF